MKLESLEIPLGDRRYSIHFLEDQPELVAETAGAYQQGYDNALLVTDENVRSYQKDFLLKLGLKHNLSMRPGEGTKRFNALEALLEHLAEIRVDRKGALFAVGGGVIGDLAGFAAACYLRGIDFYQVPTTLLAMVDSSVGGKTGINLKAGKNLVGAFWQPKAVFVDTSLLRSLPEREFSAGMAEVIKYGALGDAGLFEQLEGFNPPLSPKHPELARIIRRCCEIKAEIVVADEKETAASGGRALLNLGHTFAHAIEAVTAYEIFRHGEAVAVGLILAARLSERILDFTTHQTLRLAALLEKYELPVSLTEDLPDGSIPEVKVDDLMAAMQRDKKVKNGRLRFVAMEDIGRAQTVEDVAEALVRDLWREAGAV